MNRIRIKTTLLQMTTTVLLVVIISSAPVEVKKNLTGTEGGSITLPDPVVQLGFVSFKGQNIAMVDNGQIRILKKTHRLFWNETSGLFTVRGLQRNDSGIYIVDDQKRDFIASYQLKVYESIHTPAVATLSVSAESCTLQCLVDKAEETTLSWYKDEDVVNHSSSALPLPYTVDKQHFNSSYRCVAANPAEEKTLPVNVHTSCSEQDAENTDSRGNTANSEVLYIIVTAVVLTVIVVLVALIIKNKYVDKTKRTTMRTQDSVKSDVLYTDILTTDRHTQEGNSPDSSGPVDRSNLTTVYDRLEAHRMLPIHTDPTDHVYDQTITCPRA